MQVLVFTNDYVAAGNDGYTLLAAAPTVVNRTTDVFAKVVGSYLVSFCAK